MSREQCQPETGQLLCPRWWTRSNTDDVKTRTTTDRECPESSANFSTGQLTQSGRSLEQSQLQRKASRRRAASVQRAVPTRHRTADARGPRLRSALHSNTGHVKATTAAAAAAVTVAVAAAVAVVAVAVANWGPDKPAPGPGCPELSGQRERGLSALSAVASYTRSSADTAAAVSPPFCSSRFLPPFLPHFLPFSRPTPPYFPLSLPFSLPTPPYLPLSLPFSSPTPPSLPLSLSFSLSPALLLYLFPFSPHSLSLIHI